MALNTFTTIAFGLALAVIAEAYQAGAPVGVCESLTPSHGVDGQTSEFPYTITTTKKGTQILINLKPNSATDSFKGFIIQVRDSTDKPIGSFNTPPDTKSLDCQPGKKNALTHNSAKDKKEIKATWTAPQNFAGSVYVIATVARDGGVFWVGHKTSPIKIENRRN